MNRTPFQRFTHRLALAAVITLTGVPVSAKDNPSVANRFTIAVIPDTQNYIDYKHQAAEGFPFDASRMFLEQMQYIADHAASGGKGDIVFATSLGDVWQHQTMPIDPLHMIRGFRRAPNPVMDAHFAPTPKTREVEMPMARKGFELIDGKLPFSVVPGNHDHDAMWTDANHPPKAEVKGPEDVGMLHSAGLINFKMVFSNQSKFFKGKDWYVASHKDGANSAQIFTAGGYRFLHIGLQFDPPNDALAWAAAIVKQFPGLPTIVSTHDYLDNDGQRLPSPIVDNHAVDPQDNSPQMIWDKFISQNDQVFLVLCGHESGQALRVDDNSAGHKVYQVLSDYQDRGQTAKNAGVKLNRGEGIGDGWMRLMTFDMSGAAPTIQVQTYSTHYKKRSRDVAEYAAWYKAAEKPKMTDAEFQAQDDFVIQLSDFRKRFGEGEKHKPDAAAKKAAH